MNPTLTRKYLRLALGGNMDEEEQNQFAGASATVAGLGNGLLDAFDQPNEYGHQSVGTTAAKSALSYGAAGASIGGPVGAGVGAALGLGMGLVNGFKARKQDGIARTQKFMTEQQSEKNRSAAAIASDPTLISGYRNAQMFADGGTISNVTPQVASGDKSVNGIPDYLYYLKAVQTGNHEAANSMIAHLTGIQKPETISSLQFLGKSMQNSNVFDLAKRNLNTEKDPEMRTLYGQLNENPDLFNKFQFNFPKSVAVKAAGGTIDAPLAKAYMTGGTAKPLSSDTTELQGNSHAEGGIDIPQMGANVEGGETTAQNFVFSKELGFAKLHKPIAKAKGIIENKPQTIERLNAMKHLNQQEKSLAMSQEYLKQQLGIQ